MSSAQTGSTQNNSTQNNSTETDLTQIEQKLFQHDYPTDSDVQRIERLEKMVFGKEGTGSGEQRLAALKAATITSALESNANNSSASSSASNSSSNGNTAEHNRFKTNPIAKNRTGQNANGGQPQDANKEQSREANMAQQSRQSQNTDAEQSGDLTQYPAVTAIEKRLFSRDYSSDPITTRLDRLDLKVFNKISDSNDLGERTDRLKQATGIDIAKQVSTGSDWVEDDGDLSSMDVGQVTPFSSASTGGGTAYHMRRIQDLEDDADRRIDNNVGGGTVPFSIGNGFPFSGSAAQTPPITRAPQLGLSQEITSLEKEIFGKTYAKDALPARVNRLEAAVFPDQKPAIDKPLSDRVSRLLAVVPLSSNQGSGNGSSQSQYGDDPLASSSSGQNQTHKHGGKLSKLLGSMLGFTGSYPGSNSNNLSMDPQTGLLYDSSTGSLIDPSTGAVIGQRMGSTMGGVSPWGFGSGMSPFGTMPYGYGAGRGLDFGMGGMGMGMGGFGGMWP